MRIPLSLAALAALAACQSTEPTADPTSPRPDALVVRNGAGAPDFEEFEICKLGSAATFSYTVFNKNTGATTNGQATLADGDCQVIALVGGAGADVSVTENVPAGFLLDRVDVTVLTSGPTLTTRTESGPTVSDAIAGGGTSTLRGVLAVFYNVAEPPPPPPPPPAGGEGCTPGYWKQAHHFDSWASPYLPGQLFSTYFEDAFPGKTLVQVLGQGGGGLKALGRHTVAALLNAASSGVSFDLSTADVVSAFNAAFPGGDYESLKDRLAKLNEQGCPLN
ncbi:MAG: hypothetical protein AB7R55_03750 [Gemmatimonadales bacterium]